MLTEAFTHHVLLYTESPASEHYKVGQQSGPGGFSFVERLCLVHKCSKRVHAREPESVLYLHTFITDAL